MVKGYIDFRKGKIPFVIENYRMELFTDDNRLADFSKEHNQKRNYVLYGHYLGVSSQGQAATFLVEHSIGGTCYLRCYIINMVAQDREYDTIGLQSLFLDDIFSYKYKFLDLVRKGVNLAIAPQSVYQIPFYMNDIQYELNYQIGQDSRLGLLEDFDKKGEFLLPLHNGRIQECYDISVVLYRLAMFVMSSAEVPFRQITLYKSGIEKGWFYCPLVSEKAVSGHDAIFHDYDVMKYIPPVLNNIAKDSGNRITKSIPLGHLQSFKTLFSPQRFLQQVLSFEYLFDKLEHKKAQSRSFPLKDELKCMIDEFPQFLHESKYSSEEVSEKIKETRRLMTHGYVYYYDFKDDSELQHLIIILDKLIRNMSLLLVGFSKEEINRYPIL